ncbi:MAG: flagellar protein FlgN [Lachnospiraceae bacterium]|nr:flagellar protein FlgN [Lachnospiraceae bacterium]
MQVLIETLDKEEKEYVALLELSRKKTPIIIEGDVEKLQAITDEEQMVVDRVVSLDKKREEAMNDIAEVINKDVKTLKLSYLIDMLDKRPKEREELARVHDRIKATVGELRTVNDQNRVLIEQSLDIVNFNLNLVKSMRQAPETGNYTRNAGMAGDFLGGGTGGFDAKQ